MSTRSPLLLAGALLGCAYVLSRQLGRKPAPAKPTAFDVNSHYSAIGDAIRAHAQAISEETLGKGLASGTIGDALKAYGQEFSDVIARLNAPTIGDYIKSHAQEISDVLRRLDHSKLRTLGSELGQLPIEHRVLFTATGKDLKATLGR
jgi:hypothetical protein